MMILWTIVIGFVIGLIARALKPGQDDIGLFFTSIIGIAGALVASFLGQALGLYAPGQPAGLIGAVLGAILVLYLVSSVRRKPRT